jgi:hypothetical protein
MTRTAEVMTTEQDHERVMAIPSYRRWYEDRETWQFDYRNQQYAKARQMREAAKAKYDAELERIAEWEDERTNTSALYEAWSTADKRRYWKLRKV